MKRYFIIINIILVAVFLYFSVQAFSKMSAHRSEQDFTADTAGRQNVQSQTSVQRPFSYYNLINKRNLFNTGEKASPQVDKVLIEDLKQTKLKLKLLGTVTGDKQKAYAVIEDLKERKQNLYRVGDSLQNAIVKIILREKVVLNLNGKDEILGMKTEPMEDIKSLTRKKRTTRAVKSARNRSNYKKTPSRSFKTRRSVRKSTARSPKKLPVRNTTTQ